METERLLKLNYLGLIPGPDECEDAFTKRVEFCLHLKQILPELLGDKDLVLEKGPDQEKFLAEAEVQTKKLFDISPSWIPISFSNHQLAPWHGGCAWIFQMDENTPTGALLQLRQSLKSAKKYLGMYSRNELIVHELAHVGRMKFEEPRYEEFLAYQSSPSGFRRYFGPIIQSSAESMIFVLVLGLTLFYDFFLLYFIPERFFEYSLWMKLLPVSLILLAILRLIWRHRKFNHCRNQLELIFGNSEKANAVIYRLKDSEIDNLGRMKQSEIIKFFKEHQPEDLRMRMIYEAYFK